MITELPAPLDRITEGLLGRLPPAETHATCASCALCPGGGDGRRPGGRVVLSPDTKCCADQPVLPNYLVGGILAEGTEAGRASLRARMGSAWTTPLGVGGNPGAQGFFGKQPGACPHLDQGRCSIHAFRNAACATYFCKHERGLKGQRAWMALRASLRGFESRLAMACLEGTSLSLRAVQHLVASSHTVPGLSSDGTQSDAELWEGVTDREAFYIACHERVRQLDFGTIVQLADPALLALFRVARGAWEQLDEPLPSALRPGVHTVVAMSGEGVLVETYSPHDPIGLPSLLLAVLHHFDGRPVSEVLSQLASEQGVALDDAFLRELVDFEVLSGVPGGT